jgi:acetyltransferase-like isoleucine patch superfamily enzyme
MSGPTENEEQAMTEPGSDPHGARGSDVKIHGALEQPGGKLGRYMDLVLGRRSLPGLIKFELITLLVARLPGALGILLRGKLYPLILGHVGRGVIFGTGITLRHPHKIRIGDGCVIDDHVMLDAKGTTNQGIVLEEGVFLGRYSILSCKNGDITLKARANFGFYCDVFSANRVVVGADTVIAAYTYILSGGSYMTERLDVPISHQYDLSAAKPTRIGEGSWLGARVTVIEGVTTGRGSVLGAGAVVNADVPDYGIAVGVPAKTVRLREGAPAGTATARNEVA